MLVINHISSLTFCSDLITSTFILLQNVHTLRVRHISSRYVFQKCRVICDVLSQNYDIKRRNYDVKMTKSQNYDVKMTKN